MTTSARDQMLHRLVAHVRAHGLPADTSLRQLARELGTSHRMLAYYFGSRDGLLATVLTTMRAEDRQTYLSTARSLSLRDAALAMWSYYTDAAQVMEHHAFFAVFAQALREPARYAAFLASLDDWSALTEQLGVDEGLDTDTARRVAQLVVSSVRGLLMDRLTSADPAAVDEAFVLLLDHVLPHLDVLPSLDSRRS